jgi:hypothetical protein
LKGVPVLATATNLRDRADRLARRGAARDPDRRAGLGLVVGGSGSAWRAAVSEQAVAVSA